MQREISAGGVVVRQAENGWEVAVIEPRGDPAPGESDKKRHKEILALPKGLIDPGEKPPETALREIREETGLTAKILTKLNDIKYVYVRTWGDKQRVFKIVSFYLAVYESGAIDQISEDMRVEVKQARWVSLEEAERKLAYRGEREVLKLAREKLQTLSKEAQP
jgi:8-oxo-dGTP pyrophosphatase MutT (NUDIX family)